MVNVSSSLSFGRYLKTARIEKGISVEVISRQTKISPHIIDWIEEENHSRLPSPVYVKGFLRAYAQIVGANADDVIRRYVQSTQGIKAAEPGSRVRVRPEPADRFWLRLIWILFLFFFLMTLSVIYAEPGHAAAAGPKPFYGTANVERA